jgi:hypothetical protein
MTHVSSLAAGIYTYLDMYTGDISGLPDVPAATDFASLFQGSTPGTDVLRMPSVREFPSIGDAANITNVPVYGQKSSSQVNGQSDAANFEVTVNYVANDMTAFHALLYQQVAFRLMMSTSELTPSEGVAVTIAQENTQFYFLGKIEAIQVTPSLTDTTTAVVTISRQGDYIGPATIAAA